MQSCSATRQTRATESEICTALPSTTLKRTNSNQGRRNEGESATASADRVTAAAAAAEAASTPSKHRHNNHQERQTPTYAEAGGLAPHGAVGAADHAGPRQGAARHEGGVDVLLPGHCEGGGWLAEVGRRRAEGGRRIKKTGSCHTRWKAWLCVGNDASLAVTPTTQRRVKRTASKVAGGPRPPTPTPGRANDPGRCATRCPLSPSTVVCVLKKSKRHPPPTNAGQACDVFR